MDVPANARTFDESGEFTNSTDQQLEERLRQAAETPSALKPALGSSPSDGHTAP